MTYDEIINIVAKSKLDDWNIVSCWGFGSGPSYKSKFLFYDTWETENKVLYEESHGMYGCYKPNVSISLAFGIQLNGDFREEWANKFPDPSASSHCIDIFFNNSLVDRFAYVVVDGGRAKLPITSAVDNLLVDRTYANIIRLADLFESQPGNFEEYLKRAGIKIEG